MTAELIGRPTTARPTPASLVEVRVRERIGAFEDAVRRTRAGEDREALHDLRVASRRLIVLIRTWRDLFPDGVPRPIVRRLRSMRRRVARARDIEVRLELLRDRLERSGPPDPEAVKFLQALEDRVERRRRRAARRVRPGRCKDLITLLRRAEQDMSGDLLSHLKAFESAHRRERRRRETAIDQVRLALEAGDEAALHVARIATRSWRYAVEGLGEESTPLAGITLATLRELQDALGGICDRALLREALSRHLDDLGGRSAGGKLASILDGLELERGEELARFRALALSLLRAVLLPPVTTLSSAAPGQAAPVACTAPRPSAGRSGRRVPGAPTTP